MSERSFISPGPVIPISRTAKSASSGSVSSDIGSPITLLKLPSVFQTFPAVERTDAINSFVVVFPTLPVTPTRLALQFFEYSYPSLPSAFTVSSTRIIGISEPSGILEQRAQPAPAAITEGRKLCPSTLSPTIAMKSEPSSTSLESVQTELIFAEPSPIRLPPQRLASSATVGILLANLTFITVFPFVFFSSRKLLEHRVLDYD